MEIDAAVNLRLSMKEASFIKWCIRRATVTLVPVLSQEDLAMAETMLAAFNSVNIGER